MLVATKTIIYCNLLFFIIKFTILNLSFYHLAVFRTFFNKMVLPHGSFTQRNILL